MEKRMAPVKLVVSDGVARLTFDRPEALNAVDVATAECLLAQCRALQGRDDVRVVVLAGSGRAFMAGGDLAAFQAAADPADLASAIIRPLHAALEILAGLPVPVIGSVHGAVAGAGFSLAVGCDLTLAAQDARFCLAYLGIATTIDGGGSWHLVRQVGLQRALDLAYTNRSISAEEAAALGLIARVVPSERLEDETDLLARRLAAGPTFAYGGVKRLLREAGNRDYATQLAAEHDQFCACAAGADFREGVAAFFERRRPTFHGR
jgi:2-(1,2-epoxy-1,2-dihydrophenyl)acetyl-CoA isomerase